MKLKLIHKLLIALFACTALVLVAVTVITRASVGRGFVDFLQLQDRSRLEQLAPVMADWFEQTGDWALLAEDPRQFRDLVMSLLPREAPPGRMRGPGTPGQGPPGARGPRGGPGRFNSLPQRIFLLDADKAPVLGRVPPVVDPAGLAPIELNQVVVGWLGVSLPRAVEMPEERAFITQLRKSLLIGLAIGLAMAAALAWLLARHLSSPINAVAAGMRGLAAGRFDTRVSTRGDDEIARLGGNINRLAEALREHETVRKRWMSDIAHDLRTPLSIIAGELEAMADGVRPLSREQLASVQEEVRHLAAIVEDLHQLALTDSGALAYKMRSVDLEELAESVVEGFRGSAERHALELSHGGPGGPCRILGDEQRLRQLLHNLLDNAVRYTRSGGAIRVRLSRAGGSAWLTVSDTAPGPTAEQCERLFERLYRLETSRNRDSGGSGLGLAICRNIVEAHGGSIVAEPGPDGGLMVTVRLPLEA
jgi:two-component system sensor histidine kinase BaeS